MPEPLAPAPGTTTPTLTPFGLAVRRLIDIVLSAIALIILAIPMAVIAAVIYVDNPGPVFYRQRRCGQGGRSFKLWKFRTMVRNADELKESLRERSAVAWPDFRVHDDPRVTRVGGFLRRTSLDELPQLINVLRGDMALVGPRPTSFEASTYETWQTARLDLTPGLTGPWQVLGRDSMDFEERCRLEVRFFSERTLARELRLILATFGTVLRRTGVS